MATDYKQQETILKSINDLQHKLNENVKDNFTFTERISGGLNKQLKIYNQIIEAGKDAIKNGKQVHGQVIRDIQLMGRLSKQNLSIKDLEKEKNILLKESLESKAAGLEALAAEAQKDADMIDSKQGQIRTGKVINAQHAAAGTLLGINFDRMNELEAMAMEYGKDVAAQVLALELSVKFITAMGSAYASFAELVDSVGLTFGAAGKAGFANELYLATANAKGLGFGFEDVAASTLELSNNFGYSFDRALALTETVADMSRVLGVGMEEGSRFVGILTTMGGMSERVALDFAKSADQLAIAAGVAPAQIMKDIAENGELFAIHSKDGGRNLLEAAVQARRLGTDMGTITGISDGLLDFQSSLTAELEASVLIGRQLNLQDARKLALAKDYSGMTKVILGQLGSVEEFNSMNVIQQRALAAAIGIGVEDLSKFIANADDAGKSLGTIKPFGDLVGEDALSSLANLQNSLAEIGAVLIQTFAPILEVVMGIFSGIANFISENVVAMGALKGALVVLLPILTAVASILVFKSIAAAWTAAMEFAGLTGGFGLPAAIALGTVATGAILGAVSSIPRFADLPSGQTAMIQSGVAIADAGESIVRTSDMDGMGGQSIKELQALKGQMGEVVKAITNLKLETTVRRDQLNIVMTPSKA